MPNEPLGETNRGFREAVTRHFAFLSDCGFRPVTINDAIIRYFSPVVSFEISQDDGLGDISVALRSTAYDTEMLSLEDICSSLGVKPIPLHAISRNYTERAIAWIADIFRGRCMPLLLGDDFAWNAATKVAKERARLYTDDLELAHIRSLLAPLWKSRAYREVIALLSPVENRLAPSEAKKLSIARRHLEQS